LEFPKKKLQRYTKILTRDMEKKLTGQPWNILVVISRVTLFKKKQGNRGGLGLGESGVLDKPNLIQKGNVE
jgi:hypothetical protein